MVPPRLMLLDEPSLGSSLLMVDRIFKEIRDMQEKGVSFLPVEQDVRRGFFLFNREHARESGKSLAGSGDALLRNTELQRFYPDGET